MPIHTFLARSFDTTHENEVFDAFLERLEIRWAQTDEDVVVIGNPIWNGATPDTVVIRQKAITIIDFKNFGGCIEITENGPWMCKGTPVKGGSKANPFVQVSDNKRLLKDWFEGLPSEGKQNFWRGIFGLIVFHKPVELKGRMAPATDRWFRIADLDHAVETLGYFSSNDLSLSKVTLLEIPNLLGVRPYTRAGVQTSIEALDGSGADTTLNTKFTLSQSQAEAITSLKQFLLDDSKNVFRVLGMTSTGKSSLGSEIEAIVNSLDRQLVRLAPNNRLATSLTTSSSHMFKGIYSHIYSSSTEEFEQETNTEPMDKGKRKRKILRHPLLPCDDPENCVYVFDEAHLVGNAYFEREGERYGTGHLWDDFLAFSGIPGSKRKVILIGDPYQLSRGSMTEMPIHKDILIHKSLSADSYELERVIITDDRSTLIRNAKSLVQAIRNQEFNHLDLLFDADYFKCPPKEENQDLVLTRFQDDPRSHVILVFSNKEANELNVALRQNLFEAGDVPLVKGDRVELYSPIRSDNMLEESGFHFSGALATVTTTTNTNTIQQRVQTLKGRETPIRWREGKTELTLDSDGISISQIPFLVDFIESEKPEIDSSMLVALKVFYNKSTDSEGQSCKDHLARLRYAYATTCHHAQGTTRPSVFINANTGQGRCSEEYFRWIYTAITRAEREILFLNYRPLTPLTEARWSDKGIKIVPEIKGALTIKIDHNIIPTQDELKQNYPTWSTPKPSQAQLLFWLSIKKCLEPNGWAILKVASHPYQEQYDLAGPNETSCSISLSYNQAKQITAIRPAHGTDASIVLGILGNQSDRVILSDPRALSVLNEIQQRLSKAEWIIEEIKESKFLLALRVSSSKSGKVKLDMHYNGDGMITTIRATEAVNVEDVYQLQRVLLKHDELMND